MRIEPRLLVSLLIATGAFVVTLIVLFRPGTSDEMISIIVQAWLSTGLVTMVAYWLGSSKGSADNGRAIRDQLPPPPPLSPKPQEHDDEA
jgi:hypothetical protein